MSDQLDSIVKGAPAPGSPAAAAAAAHAAGSTSTGTLSSDGGSRIDPSTPLPKVLDPLQNTPSSPSMIYLNLLILEASLRAQYLDLRTRRRHHTFFLLLLAGWTLGFGYALFFATREDGKQGGSVYWGVELAEKLCFMCGLITSALVWGTGIWERGIRWPRKWLLVSNRGLRTFNCKLILMRRRWWEEALSTIGWFLTYGVFSPSATSSYRYVDAPTLREAERELNITSEHRAIPGVRTDTTRGHDDDLAPGGDYVKLLLLPKPFSASFRENWEQYRAAYWALENKRRALIREKLRMKDRKLAREAWPWTWWLPWRKPEKLSGPGRTSLTGHAQNKSVAHLREHRRTTSFGSVRSTGSTGRRGSNSSSKRPATPVVSDTGENTSARRSSMSSTTSDAKKKQSLSGMGKGSLKQRSPHSRTMNPDIPSPLSRESSFHNQAGDSMSAMGTGPKRRAVTLPKP